MKHRLFSYVMAFTAAALLGFGPPGLAKADTYPVHVVWDLPNPPSDLKGFLLECWPATGQRSDSTIVNIPVNKAPWEYDLDLNLNPDGSKCVMRSVDNAGNESIDSDVVTINPPPPRVINIQINIRIQGTDVTVTGPTVSGE